MFEGNDIRDPYVEILGGKETTVVLKFPNPAIAEQFVEVAVEYLISNPTGNAHRQGVKDSEKTNVHGNQRDE